MAFDLNQLKFNDQGLIPAIIQDHLTNQVLMMAYMNQESLAKTLASGETWFWSRSRQKLWHKGETSGHVQKVKEVYYDCDGDTLLFAVEQTGAACHEGYQSCFHNRVDGAQVTVTGEQKFNPAEVYGTAKGPGIMAELYDLILDRKAKLPEGSYTTYLFTKGVDKICKKVGEESAEVIIAAKNNSKPELTYESADLIYHLLVLLANQGITPEEVYTELAGRRK